MDGFDGIERYQHKFSQGEFRWVFFRPGFELMIDDTTIYRSHGVENHHGDEMYVLASKFCVSGYSNVICPDIRGVEPEYAEQGGQHYLFYLPDIDEIEQSFENDHIRQVKIYMDLDVLRAFNPGMEGVPKLLRSLMETDAAPRFHRSVGQITPQMQTVIQHLLQSPFQGMMQRIYLESKVLELLALQFTQLVEAEQGKQAVSGLKPRQIDRIHQARDILIRQMNSPPSILDLAQQVGLHHMKLKQGFRQVFGTTVFGYLHDYRMQMALQLLQDGKLSVTQIAETVGCSHLGYFSGSFKRKYGITPSACRSGEKPTF